MKQTFPGFDKCLAAVRQRRDPQKMEEGFFWLLSRAGEYVPELMDAFGREEDAGVRRWLLELVHAARSPAAIPLLFGQLRSEDDSLRHWAIRGLKLLDTREARTPLWQARSFAFRTPEETEAFRRDLDAVEPFHPA